MSGQIRLRIQFKKYATKWFDYLMVSKEEMKEFLKGTGWRVKSFIESEGSYYIGIIEKRNDHNARPELPKSDG